MLHRAERTLVQLATEHAKSLPDNDDHHSVAAALLLRSGETVFGVNTYHFLGGPCGEVSALSNRAATHPDDPIDCVVAVHGPSDMSVIAPCGKCRQILFDLDPDIRCIVRDAMGLSAVAVRDLLPYAFDRLALDAPQGLYMWEGLEQIIRDGKKTQTIRVDDPFRPGPAQLVFEKESGETVTLAASIDSVRTVALGELTESDAQRDGFSGLDELHSVIGQFYSGLQLTDQVDVVAFTVQPDA